MYIINYTTIYKSAICLYVHITDLPETKYNWNKPYTHQMLKVTRIATKKKIINEDHLIFRKIY